MHNDHAKGNTSVAAISSPSRAWFVLVVFSLLVVLVFLGGCVTKPPVPSDNHTDQNVVVDYTRTGGIAAFDDRLVIFENGQAVYSRRNRTGEFTLPSDGLSELKRLLSDADFPSLASSYPAPSPGADYFSYTITHDGKTVTTETGGIPDPLVAVIGRLDSILADYAPLI
jgi:hypothetical protein